MDRDYQFLRLREKGNKVRTMPLHARAAGLLPRLARDGRTGRVFPWATPQRVYNVRKALKKAAALKGSSLHTYHLLRHWFISQAVLQGIPPKVVAAWVGHSDGGQLVSTTYSHLNDEASMAAMARLNLRGPASWRNGV